MSVAKFLKDNLVLVVGLTLPVLLMAGFLAVSALPDRTDPPKYDFVFSTQDYPSSLIPITVRLLVKDHVLVAQYTKLPSAPAGYASAGWRKLYLYDAGSRTVRQLEFGFPPDLAALEGTREEPVAAAAGMTLDPALRSPDGYELSFGDRRGGGLLLEMFGGSRAYEPRLRKDGRSVPISAGGREPFGFNSDIEFLGWVTAKR